MQAQTNTTSLDNAFVEKEYFPNLLENTYLHKSFVLKVWLILDKLDTGGPRLVRFHLAQSLV